MVNMQAKLALAFLGSTLVSVMIWDRGSRNGEPELVPHHDDDETYELTDEERIFPRSKRAVVNYKLSTMFQQFNDAERCCPIPGLLPNDVLESCAPIQYRKKQKSGGRVVTTNKNGNWFGSVQKYFFQDETIKKTTAASKKRGKRQDSGDKIPLKWVCYMNCVFSQLNLLNNTALDVVQTEEVLVNTRINSNWREVVQNAVYTCEEPSACATPSEIQYERKYCSLKPTIMMNCVRKHMVNNCPPSYKVKDGRCNTYMAAVKKMNVFTLA